MRAFLIFLLVAPAAIADDIGENTKRATVVVSQEMSRGSGVIVASDGKTWLILTAAHCCEEEGGVEISAYPYTETLDAEIVRFSESSDIALLKVNAAGRFTPGVVPICARKPDVGSSPCDVITVGCNTFPPSIQSDRIIAENERGWFLEQTIAAGRSGGPVVLTSGELVGLHKANTNANGVCCNLDDIVWIMKEPPLSFASRYKTPLLVGFTVGWIICFFPLVLYFQSLKQFWKESWLLVSGIVAVACCLFFWAKFGVFWPACFLALFCAFLFTCFFEFVFNARSEV